MNAEHEKKLTETESDILLTVHTENMVQQNIKQQIKAKVAVILNYYIQRNLITATQYREISFRATRKLLGKYETKTTEIKDCVQEYTIKILSKIANKRRTLRETSKNG